MTVMHAQPVARLHLDYLRSPFQGRPGFELLRIYYSTLADGAGNGAVGYTAVEGKEILGFVCGVFDPGRFNNYLLKSQALHLLAWGGLLVINHPGMLFDLGSRLVKPGKEFASISSEYELRPIVVSSAARGGGVAQALMAALLQDAAGRGYDSIYLYTEEDNSAANRFYQKTNFRFIGQVNRGGQVYCCYERSVMLNE